MNANQGATMAYIGKDAVLIMAIRSRRARALAPLTDEDRQILRGMLVLRIEAFYALSVSLPQSFVNMSNGMRQTTEALSGMAAAFKRFDAFQRAFMDALPPPNPISHAQGHSTAYLGGAR